jgi:hypothetical protein
VTPAVTALIRKVGAIGREFLLKPAPCPLRKSKASTTTFHEGVDDAAELSLIGEHGRILDARA